MAVDRSEFETKMRFHQTIWSQQEPRTVGDSTSGHSDRKTVLIVSPAVVDETYYLRMNANWLRHTSCYEEVGTGRTSRPTVPVHFTLATNMSDAQNWPTEKPKQIPPFFHCLKVVNKKQLARKGTQRTKDNSVVNLVKDQQDVRGWTPQQTSKCPLSFTCENCKTTIHTTCAQFNCENIAASLTSEKLSRALFPKRSRSTAYLVTCHLYTSINWPTPSTAAYALNVLA